MQSWLESLVVPSCSGNQMSDNNLLKLNLIKMAELWEIDV